MTTDALLIPHRSRVLATYRGQPMVLLGNAAHSRSTQRDAAAEAALVARAAETRGPVELQTKFDFRGGE